ncbi:CBO0543 family protein [Litchfieldia salsa]|uniref:Uncharacterized protein n=1 Tax=Litchfieldia salsa TaxID=930152 RepID=A0A1H0TZH5_9BACI|nr:CBO0543 family protein [Litchfieldia salsa]SDP59304.1 hypothetical protein SAMN05216565_10443 [Litchfieldia salsa]
MEKQMNEKQLELYEEIRHLIVKTTEMKDEYWHAYNGLDTWQFWLIFLGMFVAPLVILYFLIDRDKMSLLGFYGYNIHVWFSHIDNWGTKHGLWGYPYELVPFIPGNLSLDVALVPILYMLVYQWTLNQNKNYYIYTLALSVFLSFIFKPILSMHHLFKLHEWVTFLHIFAAYCALFIFSKLITNIFIWMSKQGTKKGLFPQR